MKLRFGKRAQPVEAEVQWRLRYVTDPAPTGPGATNGLFHERSILLPDSMRFTWESELEHEFGAPAEFVCSVNWNTTPGEWPWGMPALPRMTDDDACESDEFAADESDDLHPVPVHMIAMNTMTKLIVGETYMRAAVTGRRNVLVRPTKLGTIPTGFAMLLQSNTFPAHQDVAPLDPLQTHDTLSVHVTGVLPVQLSDLTDEFVRQLGHQSVLALRRELREHYGDADEELLLCFFEDLCISWDQR